MELFKKIDLNLLVTVSKLYEIVKSISFTFRNRSDIILKSEKCRVTAKVYRPFLMVYERNIIRRRPLLADLIVLPAVKICRMNYDNIDR